MPVELTPDASEPIETAPGQSLTSMARRALDAVQPAVVRCYEELIVRRPTATGEVEVQLDLAASGVVTGVHADYRGEGLQDALACWRGVFAGLRVQGVDPGGQYVSRVYTFHNPPIDRVVRDAVIITPPPRPPRARARPRRGAPAAPAPVAPTAPVAPAPGPGSLRAEELTRSFTDVPTLRACAPLALRRGRRGDVTATLRVTVAGDGGVTEAHVDATPPLAANVTSCVESAARDVRLRPSGITVRARMPLVFRR